MESLLLLKAAEETIDSLKVGRSPGTNGSTAQFYGEYFVRGSFTVI